MPRLTLALCLLLLCASCAPAAPALPAYSAEQLERMAAATRSIESTERANIATSTAAWRATLDTLAIAQTQQAAQLRSDAATATVAAQQARETATATAAIATAVQAEHQRETQQAIAFGVATQGAIATNARELRQHQDAAAVAEAWRIGAQALIAIVCVLAALLAFSAYQFTATGREMYAEAQRAKIELTWADVRRKEVDVERLKVQVIAGAVIYHDASGPRVIEAARATANSSPAQYQDLPLADSITTLTGARKEVDEFLKKCIDYHNDKKAGADDIYHGDKHYIPSAGNLGMHQFARARIKGMFERELEWKAGHNGYTRIKGGRTLYDLLTLNDIGELPLDLPKQQISQMANITANTT